MKDMLKQWGLAIVLISCFIVTKGQTSTFTKQINVSVNNKVELTDMNNQPLKRGALYQVQMSVVSTGTKTGAEYLVWYDNANASWTTRAVTVNGTHSNHPTLEVTDGVVKVGTQHNSTYRVRIFVAYYDAANVNTIPTLFGSSYHWQRNASRLYYLDGNVGIGTAAPTSKLAVNGTIRAKEIMVEASNWPDYVFAEEYELQPLGEVAAFVREHGHLPGIPKAAEVEAEGVSLGEMNKLLLKKIEELTLHLIERDEKVAKLELMTERIDELEKKIEDFNSYFQSLDFE